MILEGILATLTLAIQNPMSFPSFLTLPHIKGFTRILWLSLVSAHFLEFVVFPNLHMDSLDLLGIHEILKIPLDSLGCVPKLVFNIYYFQHG